MVGVDGSSPLERTKFTPLNFLSLTQILFVNFPFWLVCFVPVKNTYQSHWDHRSELKPT